MKQIVNQYLELLSLSGIESIKKPAKIEVPELTPAEKGHLLQQKRIEYSDCDRCQLHLGRTNFVYGNGDSNSKLMLIGEGPGEQEDKTGDVFVGVAGQLLTKMLTAINLNRDDVYICNIVKCRPPANRNPLPDEVKACSSYIQEQIEIIKPEFILLLGRVAAHNILKTTSPLSQLRGKTYKLDDIQVVVSYHPSALLRNSSFKKPAWVDLQRLRDMMQPNED
jgi:DNA polymerase